MKKSGEKTDTHRKVDKFTQNRGKVSPEKSLYRVNLARIVNKIQLFISNFMNFSVFIAVCQYLLFNRKFFRSLALNLNLEI